MYFLSFFFQGSVDHRDLHSFPTRRSSDLGAGWHLSDSQAEESVRFAKSEAQVVDGCSGDWGSAASAENQDRKSTRLNSSHVEISYAVFCLKKKKKEKKKKIKHMKEYPRIA